MGVFLDAASNTSLDKRVLKAMEPYLSEDFVGNTRSVHDFGIKAFKAVEEAREKLGLVFGVPSSNIIFTSGATEGNNMVIKGLAYAEMATKKKKDQKRHIVCGATEHDSIINPCKQLERIGFKVTYVKPQEDGRIHLEDVEKVIRKDTLLVCIMAVNNELGTKNEVDAITSYARECSVPTLVDCTQLVGYGGENLWLRPNFPAASFFTFSGHKIYGPAGVGCLVGNGDSLSLLKDSGLIVGGAQELGLRGGTTNVAAAVGISKAVELMADTHLENYYIGLYNYLIDTLNKEFGDKWKLNVVPDHKNIISLNFEDCLTFCDSLASSLAMREIGVSAGSACDSTHDETEGDFNPSHVLVAMGMEENAIRKTIRVSFCKTTTKKDIDALVQQIKDIQESENFIIHMCR